MPLAIAVATLAMALGPWATPAGHADGGVASDGAARKACSSRSAKALVANRFARVVLVSRTVYACPREGRPFHLGDQYSPTVSSSGGGGLTQVGLNRTRVVYSDIGEGGAAAFNTARFTVRDLRSRRTTFTRIYVDDTGLAIPVAGTVVLCRNGRTAFIGGRPTDERRQETRFEVRLSKGRRSLLLDRGHDIAPESLRATDRRLDWRNGEATEAIRVGCPAPVTAVPVG